MQHRHFKVALIAILLLAATLRLIALTKFSFGNDEVAEATWSALPFGAMMHEVRLDGVHPPLDYFVQFALFRITSREWVHRLPAVAAGIVTVAGVALLGSLWISAEAGVMAAFLLAISPMHVRYSQEMRPYALALALMVLSIYALERHARSGSRRSAVIWFLGVFATASTLYFAGMIAGVVTIGRIVAGRGGELRTLWRRLPLLLIAWAVLYAPWLSVVVTAARATPPAAREALRWSWWQYRLQTLATGDWLAEPITFGSYAFWCLVLLGIGVCVQHRRASNAVIWFVGGLALEITILQLRPHFPAVRHLLPAWLGAFMLAGAGGAWLLRSRGGRAVVTMALLLVVIFTASTLRAYYHHGRPQWLKMARFVRTRLGPGEAVYVANDWSARNFAFYWRQVAPRDTPLHELPFAPVDIAGPAWLVIAACPMAPDARARTDALPLARDFRYSNYGEIRRLDAGDRVSFDHPLCQAP